MDQSQRVTVYTPESGLRRPGQFLRDFLDDTRRSSDLAWQLFLRGVKAQYRTSFLGYLWLFAPPIVQAATWTFLRNQSVVNIAATEVPYPVFVLTGTLLWQAFVAALNAAHTSVNSNKSILVKINFPKESLLLSALYQTLFDVLVRLSILVPVFIIFGIVPSGSLVLAPVGLLFLVLFGLGLGLLLVPVRILVADVNTIIMTALPFLFLLTPVVYPTPKEGIAYYFGKYNPIAPLINVSRDWLTGATPDHLSIFWTIGLLSVPLLLVSLVVFRLAMPHVVERAGN